MIEIGRVYYSLLPYYDKQKSAISFKRRPVLVIGKADSDDYVFLPVSRVTNKQYLSKEFDVKIDPQQHPTIRITELSYIRTHKQQICEWSSFDCECGDIRHTCPDIWEEVIAKVTTFNERLIMDMKEE